MFLVSTRLITLTGEILNPLFSIYLFVVLYVPRTLSKNGSLCFTSLLPSMCWEHWSTPCLVKERCSPGPSARPPVTKNEAVSQSELEVWQQQRCLLPLTERENSQFNADKFVCCQTPPNTSGKTGLFLLVGLPSCTGVWANISKSFFIALDSKRNS